jgi:YVTN family beta-propeller protein
MRRKPFFAYVANNSSNNVSVIDTVTNTVVATILVGLSPNGVAFTPNGKRAYVANWSSNNVSVIDTATKSLVGARSRYRPPKGLPSRRTGNALRDFGA